MELELIFVVELTRIGIDFLELNGIGIDKKELTPTVLALDKTFSCDTC